MMAMASVKSDSGFVDNWQSENSLAECNLHMLTSEDSCDVSFRVGKDKKIVRAHRYILISRSCVFHAMLCGPLAEKDEITITDVESEIFTELLRYLYTNKSAPTPTNATSLLYLAKKYAVGGLEHLCLTYLKSSLSAENACVILEQAHVFDEKQLYDRAMKVILDNGEKCLGSRGFQQMSRECFDKVISSDALNVKAEQVFSAALSWAEEACQGQGKKIFPANLRSILDDTLYSIPFLDMEQKYYVEEVLPRQILTDAENVSIMAHHVCPERDPSPFRKRQQKAQSDAYCSSEISALRSTDVIFFYLHKQVSGCVGTVSGSVSFTFSHDVHLLGVYVFGSAAATTNKYKLKIGSQMSEHSFPDWFLKGEYPSILTFKFKQYHIKAIYLTKPLHIKEGVKHIINTAQVGKGQPEYEGQILYTTLAIGHGKVYGVVSNGSLNIIYGLILKD